MAWNYCFTPQRLSAHSIPKVFLNHEGEQNCLFVVSNLNNKKIQLDDSVAQKGILTAE